MVDQTTELLIFPFKAKDHIIFATISQQAFDRLWIICSKTTILAKINSTGPHELRD